MNVAVDCHMVGQPEAGDAGNARFHTLLTRALHATAAPGDAVTALIAHPAAITQVRSHARIADVPRGNAARLTRGAARALEQYGATAGIFSYITPLRSPCPLLVVVHDVTFKLHPEWFSRRVRTLLGTLVPIAVRRAARVITVSQRSKADLVEALGVDPEQVSIVTNVPAPAFANRADATAHVRERFGLDRFCLFVGDVHPRKNIAALAEAIRLLDDRRRLELVVVGRVGHKGQAILAASGARFLGPLGDDDLADLYSAAAVTGYPSLYEGFGLPVVEAMACGSPVVATTRGAIPEVAGDAAILVEPTPAALAEGLRAALEPQTADRLRAAGPARAATFTLAAMGSAAWSAVREVV